MIKFDFQTDITWLTKMSHRLERFKVASASSHVYVCRCPICGDSQTDKKKTRLYFYEKGFQLNVFCHNCGYSHAFYNFMKDAFPTDFEEYKREQLLNRLDSPSKRFNKPTNGNHQPTKEKPLEVESKRFIDGCEPIVGLSDDHYAKSYLINRGFTDREMKRLLYSDNFYITASSISKEPLSEKFPTEPRIVIPFYDEKGNIEMIQGRSIGQSSLRYISIKADPNVDKIFGKYELDKTKTSYCVEGPFDSLFVDNCIATCDSNLLRSNADVLVFDNQPRNNEIVELMQKAIDRKRSIVVWPTSPNKKEDINDMILGGMTRKQLMKIIQDNTFSGMRAKLSFMKWKKV